MRPYLGSRPACSTRGASAESWQHMHRNTGNHQHDPTKRGKMFSNQNPRRTQAARIRAQQQ